MKPMMPTSRLECTCWGAAIAAGNRTLVAPQKAAVTLQGGLPPMQSPAATTPTPPCGCLPLTTGLLTLQLNILLQRVLGCQCQDQ